VLALIASASDASKAAGRSPRLGRSGRREQPR
jgi:hypothetical protein